MTDVVRHRDFSMSPEPVTFTIRPDTFECVSEIPLDVLGELSSLAVQKGDANAQLNRLKELFDGVMTYESAALFRARCKRGTEEEPNPNPIGMRHVKDILPWLMEVYGLRPTEPSDDSLAGSGDNEESSTDTVFSTE